MVSILIQTPILSAAIYATIFADNHNNNGNNDEEYGEGNSTATTRTKKTTATTGPSSLPLSGILRSAPQQTPDVPQPFAPIELAAISANIGGERSNTGVHPTYERECDELTLKKQVDDILKKRRLRADNDTLKGV